MNLLKKAAFAEAELRDIADDFFVQYNVIEIGQDIILHPATCDVNITQYATGLPFRSGSHTPGWCMAAQ